jgi:carbonic anhydrase
MDANIHSDNPVSRRKALALLSLSGAAVAAGGLSAAPLRAAPAPDDVALPEIRTPLDAMAELMEGNRRFVEGRPVGPHRTLARVREVATAQSPFAAVLSCADSRVPVEIVFDQGFGDLFVCRAAGNIVTPELIGSLEFGTLVLGARAVVVLGHTGCGAVKASIAGEPVPGQISALYQHIRPAVERSATGEQEDVARENVRIQASLLRTASPVIAQLVRENKLVVAGGVYDLSTGRVTLLDV